MIIQANKAVAAERSADMSDLPESCQKAIQTISKEMGVDPHTAYAMLSLEAVLYDLSPSDERTVNMLLQNNQPCG